MPPFLAPPFEFFKQLNLNIDAYPIVTTSYLVTTTAIVTYMANYVFKPHNTVFCFIFFPLQPGLVMFNFSPRSC